MSRALFVVLALASFPLVSCGDKDDTDTPPVGDADTDADGDSDADTDADTDTEPPLEGYSGQAVAGHEGYSGTEEWFFVADEGDGEDICRIRYELENGDARTDCQTPHSHSSCIWAWDVTISSAEIVSESGMGCEGACGVTTANVSDLDGTTWGIGYNPDYYGTANVLVRDMGEGWFAAAFADWYEDEGTFTY